MSLILSMAAFALATSITPGPVNVVALSSGARFGFGASQKHVAGAAVGFTLLLVLIGLGLHELLLRWPLLTQLIQWGGVAFLLYMAYKLAVDDGRLEADGTATAPSMLYGAVMQWLNPKAWLACVAGMGLFVADGEGKQVWLFALIYLVICYLSVACWAYAGTFLAALPEQPPGRAPVQIDRWPPCWWPAWGICCWRESAAVLAWRRGEMLFEGALEVRLVSKTRRQRHIGNQLAAAHCVRANWIRRLTRNAWGVMP